MSGKSLASQALLFQCALLIVAGELDNRSPIESRTTGNGFVNWNRVGWTTIAVSILFTISVAIVALLGCAFCKEDDDDDEPSTTSDKKAAPKATPESANNSQPANAAPVEPSAVPTTQPAMSSATLNTQAAPPQSQPAIDAGGGGDVKPSNHASIVVVHSEDPVEEVQQTESAGQSRSQDESKGDTEVVVITEEELGRAADMGVGASGENSTGSCYSNASNMSTMSFDSKGRKKKKKRKRLL